MTDLGTLRMLLAKVYETELEWVRDPTSSDFFLVRMADGARIAKFYKHLPKLETGASSKGAL